MTTSKLTLKTVTGLSLYATNTILELSSYNSVQAIKIKRSDGTIYPLKSIRNSIEKFLSTCRCDATNCCASQFESDIGDTDSESDGTVDPIGPKLRYAGNDFESSLDPVHDEELKHGTNNHGGTIKVFGSASSIGSNASSARNIIDEPSLSDICWKGLLACGRSNSNTNVIDLESDDEDEDDTYCSVYTMFKYFMGDEAYDKMIDERRHNDLKKHKSDIRNQNLVLNTQLKSDYIRTRGVSSKFLLKRLGEGGFGSVFEIGNSGILVKVPIDRVTGNGTVSLRHENIQTEERKFNLAIKNNTDANSGLYKLKGMVPTYFEGWNEVKELLKNPQNGSESYTDH